MDEVADEQEYIDEYTTDVDTEYEVIYLESQYDGAEYSEFVSDFGIIRVYYELTLGDAMIFTVLSVIAMIMILKTFFNLIWKD